MHKHPETKCWRVSQIKQVTIWREQRPRTIDPGSPNSRECGSLPSTDRSGATRRSGNSHWEHGTKPAESFSKACTVPAWSPARGPKRGTERTSADSWRTYFPSLLLGRAGRPKMGPQISPTNAVRMRPHLYNQPGLGAPTGTQPEQQMYRKHIVETSSTLSEHLRRQVRMHLSQIMKPMHALSKVMCL